MPCRTIGDIDPEALVFVDAADSSTGKPLLMVGGSDSSTVTVYEIVERPAPYDIVRTSPLDPRTQTRQPACTVCNVPHTCQENTRMTQRLHSSGG